MSTTRIEIHIDTRSKLTEAQKQEVLGAIREKVSEYLSNPHEFVDLSGFRIFKHFTNEELAEALTRRTV
jgi:hypothetical protein